MRRGGADRGTRPPPRNGRVVASGAASLEGTRRTPDVLGRQERRCPLPLRTHARTWRSRVNRALWLNSGHAPPVAPDPHCETGQPPRAQRRRGQGLGGEALAGSRLARPGKAAKRSSRQALATPPGKMGASETERNGGRPKRDRSWVCAPKPRDSLAGPHLWGQELDRVYGDAREQTPQVAREGELLPLHATLLT